MLDFKTYFVTKKTVKLIFITPIITTLLISLLFAFPSTNDFGFWLLKENSPIELLTFIIFLCSGIYGIHLTLKVKALLKNEIKFFFNFLFYLFNFNCYGRDFLGTMVFSF